MANTLDTIHTRIAAILAGTYPVSGTAPNRQITPGAFAAGSFRLPLENPKFPSVPVERRFDLRWSGWEYEDPNPDATNTLQTPVLVRVDLDLRISYAFTQAPALVPPGQLLAMGAFEAATRKALNDWTALSWGLLWPPNWNDLLVNLDRRAPATTSTVDGIRVELFVPLRMMVSVSMGTTMPELGT